MQVLAVIPARGGSKGIPRKNVLPLAGLPLVAHSIGQAKASKHIGRVVVSTDDPEIGKVAATYGAEVVWRPAEISGDSASSEAALLQVLEHLEKSEGYRPDLIVFLQCTSPLTATEDIDGTIGALIEQKADTAVAVTPFHYFLWKPEPDGGAVGINHDKSVRLLRQQREPQYLETGAVYVMKAAEFRQAKHRFFGRTALFVTPAERRLEIDDPVDFEVAEVLLRNGQSQDRMQLLPARIGALVLDFDGVLTDNKVITFQDGAEAVACSRSDGLRFPELRKHGVAIVVISTEVNPVVQARCRKLKIQCVQGLENKLQGLEAWLAENQIEASNVVYVGNDLNDVTCMKAVGCPVAVADALEVAKSAARIVLASPGGSGAVREITDLILTKVETAHA